MVTHKGFFFHPGLSIMDSGVHLSLHEKCHGPINYAKLCLKTEYLPPFGHKIWDYNRSEIEKVLVGLIHSHMKMCMNK